MVSNIWALHEMAKTFRREEGDRLLFPMHAVRLLCLAQKDRATDDAKAWMKGLDGIEPALACSSAVLFELYSTWYPGC